MLPLDERDALTGFNGGVIDTSTLIYFDKLDLLSLILVEFKVVVVMEVAKEFGKPVPGGTIYQREGDTRQRAADAAVVDAAVALHLPVLSEDKALLYAARAKGLRYYNSLMLLLILLTQDKIDHDQYLANLEKLKGFAHYGERVFAYGQKMYSQLYRDNRNY